MQLNIPAGLYQCRHSLSLDPESHAKPSEKLRLPFHFKRFNKDSETDGIKWTRFKKPQYRRKIEVKGSLNSPWTKP
jgi:hypothetical protein